ncbi:hypothetical protein LMG33818_001651 [Halomonadaceae bacterium LMG 33818]|uniref:glycosyltransferase n=1 Tax=Cernens ardua TaxID=3402176 RepID=UPI003EDC46A3
MTHPDLSIIVPIKAKSIDDIELARVKLLVENIPDNIELVIVDDGSAKPVRKYIDTVIRSLCDKSRITFKIKFIKSGWKIFSLARARNSGARIATSEVLLFQDVDFFAPPRTYKRIARYVKEKNIAQNKHEFFCIPVIFAKQEASEKIEKQLHSIRSNNAIGDSWLPVGSDIHIYSEGSSCLVVNRKEFLSMGGYDTRFYGHGAEDYEILHRLTHKYPRYKKPPEYATNFGSRKKVGYRGFRAFFSLYGKEPAQYGLVFVHLWHPPRTTKKYYRDKKNFKKLTKVMSNSNTVVGWRRFFS